MRRVGRRNRSPDRVSHPVFARCYARGAAAMERRGVADLRRRLLEGISGQVVEVGAGAGANLAHLPATVTGVVAVEPEPRLRALAERSAAEVAVPVRVVDGVADRRPADDASFEAAVVSLVLCTVPDQATALGELHRVLRPGGRLHFWEHVGAEEPVLAAVQRGLDATVWPVLAGGCRTGRNTAAAIAAAGFDVQRLERFRFPDTGVVLPTAPQILGAAVRV